MTAVPPLAVWIERQLAISAERLLASVSPVSLSRPGPRQGQVMTPARGSVLAAATAVPEAGEPDYFFHWIRDAAIVIDALLVLDRRGRLDDRGRSRFAESVAFDWQLARIDGRALAKGGWPPDVLPFLRPFVRPREELLELHGGAVAGDVRYNPDGTPDLLRWSRPQHDGPARRALTTLKLLDGGALADPQDRRRAERLLDADLAFCVRRHALPCYDPWEEELGYHFYTRLVQCAALQHGAARAALAGRPRRARRLSSAAGTLATALDGHWSASDGFIHSRMPGTGVSGSKFLDSIVLLAVLHAGLPDGQFSVHDPRVAATVERLEVFFAGHLPLNAGRRPADGVLLGRYDGDTYFDGGAFLIASFALAEFHYRRAAGNPANARAGIVRGDAVLSRLRALLSVDGRLPEQLDRVTGLPRSARDLAWSHAAFVTAADARAAASAAAIQPRL